MAAVREIRTKIASVRSTQKITKAMEMVAASKMRRAQQEVYAARPYSQKVKELAQHLVFANDEYHHPYVSGNGVSSDLCGFIVISSDKGLCGGLNAGLIRFILSHVKDNNLSWEDCPIATIGSRAHTFFKRFNANLTAHVSLMGTGDHFANILGVTQSMLELYDQLKIGRLCVVFNEFVNTMKQVPVVETLLPLSLQPAFSEKPSVFKTDYLYEPDPASVVSLLLERYVESFVYESVLEHNASEQSARMVAMKAASENAGELISKLKLAYNKSRQAAITTELAEIVSGSSAV